MFERIITRIFISQWMTFVIISVLLLGAAEAGFLFGLRLYRAKDEPRKAQIGAVQAAILGLLALLLGFTFSLAEGRYEARRELVIQEVNAIGTTYLRAALLPEAHRQDVENLLRRYVDARIDFYHAGENRAEQDGAEQVAAKIQGELWAHAAVVGKEIPTAVMATFITTLNETIDLDASRLYALRSRVPGAVWMLVMAVALCGTFASGYSAGASGERSSFTNGLLPLLIALAITLIADLDRTYGGLIRIDEQPLLNLKETLQPGRR